MIMPYYILSNVSYIKNNEYKFGYSSKRKYELLNQYEKNKRLITNPFILQWWDVKGYIKEEKIIHKILRKYDNIEHISSEWYKCDNLLYFIKIIDKEISNIKKKNENDIYDIQKEIVLLSNIEFYIEKKITKDRYSEFITQTNNILSCLIIRMKIINKKNKNNNLLLNNIINKNSKKQEIKTFYINEQHVKELLEYIDISYNNLYEDILGYRKNYYLEKLLKKWKKDLDEIINDFNNIHNDYKIYI